MSWTAYYDDMEQMTQEGNQGLTELRSLKAYISENVMARKVEIWKENFEMKWAALAHRHMSAMPNQTEMMDRFLGFRSQADELLRQSQNRLARACMEAHQVRADAEMAAQVRQAQSYAFQLRQDSLMYAQRAQDLHNWKYTRYLRNEPFIHTLPYQPGLS